MKKFEIPALLSLLAPGFGQLVKGHSAKMLFIWIVSLLLILNWRIGWIIFNHVIDVSMGIYFVLTAWSVYDAYNADKDWKGALDN